MMMNKMCTPGMVAKWLLIIGGLNWGLWGAFNINVVNMILGSWMMVERIVYVLVGVAALVVAAHMLGMCKKCCGAGGKCEGGKCSGDAQPKM